MRRRKLIEANPVRFFESFTSGKRKNEVPVLIIEEGPGNRKDKFWYTRNAVLKAGPVFRGVPVFADHSSLDERRNRPERSVKDMVGRIRETMTMEGKNGRLQCIGALKLVEGKSTVWAKERINESMRAVKEGFPPIMQLSINAEGPVDEDAKIIDGKDYFMVEGIDKAGSVDLVTKGGMVGAGFQGFMESYYGNANSKGESFMAVKLKGIMSPEEFARFERINKQMTESVSDKGDRDFLESINARYRNAQFSESDEEDDEEDGEENDEAENDTDDTDDEEEGDGDKEATTILTLEDGSEVEVGEPDEFTEEGKPVWHMADGNTVILDAPVGDEMHESGGDEDDDEDSDLDNLSAKHPAIVNRLLKKTAKFKESDARTRIVTAETKLEIQKSKALAGRLLREADVSPAILCEADLAGLDEAEMLDRISRARDYDEYISSKVENMMQISGGNFRESSGGATPQVGARILSGALSE